MKSFAIVSVFWAFSSPALFAQCEDQAQPLAANGAGQTAQHKTRFLVIDLGADVEPLRVANNGWVLLQKSFPNGSAKYYRWKGGTFEELKDHLGQSAYAFDMNDSGAIIGLWSQTAPTENLAGLYWAPGASVAQKVSSPFQVLPNPYAPAGTAPLLHANFTAISSSGEVFGMCYDNSGGTYLSSAVGGGQFGLVTNTYRWASGFGAPAQLTTAQGSPNHSWTGEFWAISRVNGAGRHVGSKRTAGTATDAPVPPFFPGDKIQPAVYAGEIDGQTVAFAPLDVSQGGKVIGWTGSRMALWNPSQTTEIGAGYPVALNAKTFPEDDGGGNTIQVEHPQIIGYTGDSLNIPTTWDYCPDQHRYVATILDEAISESANWRMVSLGDINDSGLIGATARRRIIGTPADSTLHGLLLLPIEIKDLRGNGDGDDQIVQGMEGVPTQRPGESNQAFWLRRNAYFQQQVSDKSIAYIDPHRGGNNSPDMPHLVARLLGGPTELKVKWRFEVEYLRGNGYRADYVEDFTRPEDKVLIPATGQGGNPVFTGEMDSNQEWRIFESQDWLNEIQQRGFFGGTGKLYLWMPSQQDEPTEPIFSFRIGGKNPDPQLARQFIDQSAGAQFWYAYAIARHETFGRARVNGQIRYYNQFYTDERGGPIGDASVDMGWAGWAKGWPLYNLDRFRGRDGIRHQNGAGGYGVYQLTWGPKHPNDAQGTGSNAFIPRKMVWNWQDNVTGAIAELQVKATAAAVLRDGLQASYPQWPALPNEGQLSGLEAIVVTFYNGTEGLPSTDRPVNGAIRRSCWTARTQTQGGTTVRVWRFNQNERNYVQSVNARINNTMP